MDGGANVSLHWVRPREAAALLPLWHELMRPHVEHEPAFALAPDADRRWVELAEEMAERDDAFLLVARLGELTAGYALGWQARNPTIYAVSQIGFISELVVTSAVRRRGVGRALVEGCRQWFRGRGLGEFQLATAVWNREAQAFWEAVGGAALLLRYRFLVDDSRP